MSVSAVILAGGKSSRMGSDKGLVEINGKPMVEYSIELLEELNIPAHISTSNKQYISYGLPVITDDFQDVGPMGGIHAALTSIRATVVLFISVDTPFLSEAIISQLLAQRNDKKITVAKCGKNTYPLIGVYPTRMVNEVEKYIHSGGRSVFGFLEGTPTQIISFPDSYASNFRNINTPEDLMGAEQ